MIEHGVRVQACARTEGSPHHKGLRVGAPSGHLGVCHGAEIHDAVQEAAEPRRGCGPRGVDGCLGQRWPDASAARVRQGQSSLIVVLASEIVQCKA